MTSNPSCHMVGETCSPLSDPRGSIPAGTCLWCNWTRCAMAPQGCGAMVREAGERCQDCHPMACPCEDCVAFESLEDSDGVPEEVDEAQTVKETTLTDAQLLALLDTMVECREAA
jgi:hypothetical protein